MREELAKQYIKGNGIEIGALCHPLKTDANVVYIDRFKRKYLHEQYPDIPTSSMVKVDLVDNGEELSKIVSRSKDFVIANHFLEHCKNPILTIKNWLRVLRRGGVIFCAVPNKETSFDKEREVTTWEHVEEEYLTGETNDFEHYFDWADNVGEVDDSMATAKHLFDINYSIHYHVWDKKAMKQFFDKCSQILPFNVIDYKYNDEREEFIFILKKR